MTTCNRLQLDAAPSATFADTASRQITGIAVPANATAAKGGRTWRFLDKSVKFAERVPLLAFHDSARPAGRLTAHEWTADGLRVEFSVSRTALGDELLQLANDGVLGLSLGVDVPEGGAKLVGEELHVSDALASEVSLTPIPAFAGSVIESVALSGDHNGGTAMPDCNDKPAPPPVTVNLDAAALGAAIGAAIKPPVADGPTPQPIPRTSTTQVRESAPYRFDGTAGKHGFVADALAAHNGNGEAGQRLATFLSETFAVSTGNVSALNPPQARPDLYVAPLRQERPLAGLVSTGTIADATPFTFPKFGTATNLVNPHTEGVEPTSATFTATSQVVQPRALSGKATINREVLDAGGSPQVDQVVWQEMTNAAAEAAEERIAALLDGLTLTPVALSASASASRDLTSELVSLQFRRGGSRFTGLALEEELFTGLVRDVDADGRPLLPIVNPSNANGSTSGTFAAVQIGNTTGVPVWALDDYSYLLVRSSVYQWLSPPQKLTLEWQVATVDIGLFQYSAEAVTRDADVIRISYT